VLTLIVDTGAEVRWWGRGAGSNVRWSDAAAAAFGLIVFGLIRDLIAPAETHPWYSQRPPPFNSSPVPACWSGAGDRLDHPFSAVRLESTKLAPVCQPRCHVECNSVPWRGRPQAKQPPHQPPRWM